MKTFRMIGMALFAVLMCVNFASCNNDDDGSGDGASAPGNGGKKLVKMMKYRVEDDSEKLRETVEFVYDANGNVVKTIEGWMVEGDWRTETYEYIWNSNKSITLHWDEEESVQLVLDNGKATKMVYLDEDDVETYYLDYANGYIKELGKCLEGGEREMEYTFSWVDGKLASISDGDDILTILYDGKTCKGFFPLLCYNLGYFDEIYSLIAQPELVGAKMTSLPTKMVDGDYAQTYGYELDAEGYVVGCRETYSSSYFESYEYYYSFFWE